MELEQPLSVEEIRQRKDQDNRENQRDESGRVYVRAYTGSGDNRGHDAILAVSAMKAKNE